MTVDKKLSAQSQTSWIAKHYPKILTISAAVALIASFWQAIERVTMLKNPGAILGCDINPIVDCGTVLNHRLSALFGFPNAFIGIVMFSMLFVSGLLLWLGGSFPKKFQHVVLALSTIALLFSLWFFSMSLYVIGKACIFCIFIWPASIIIFWYGLSYWLDQRSSRMGKLEKFRVFTAKYRHEPVVAIIVILIILFLFRFRDYYFG